MSMSVVVGVQGAAAEVLARTRLLSGDGGDEDVVLESFQVSMDRADEVSSCIMKMKKKKNK